MKNILLLGNGFDMYYHLPTKYANFLHVVNYLLKNKNSNVDTIGDVLSQKSLQESDSFISECYTSHKQIYDTVLLDSENISEIIKLTEKNLWFLYLNKVFNKDVGWIDFEKEIDYVLGCFEAAFKKSTILHFKSGESHIKYVIDLFGFFIDKEASKNVVTIGTYRVNSDYCLETPLGSGNSVIDKKKVVDKLYFELSNLSKALRLYLKCFVEAPMDLIAQEPTCKKIDFLSHISNALTFNYTNTYEKMYFNNNVFHIHGNVNGDIILGVNPNDADELDSINTTFVCFKKYYQRTLFETDVEYLNWINDFVSSKTEYRLIVMGHSLDVTDADILYELFEDAKEIIILYHNFDAKKSYLANLVRLFGKEGFDGLRKKKKLTLLSLHQDFTSVKKSFSEESWNDLFRSFDNAGNLINQ